jgi:hypothetical protein
MGTVHVLDLLVETSTQSAATLLTVVGPGPSLSLLFFNEEIVWYDSSS